MRAPILLGLATLLVQANALTAFFVGDDFDFLRILGGQSGLRGVLTLSFWGEWEPVWWVSWYVDQSIWGHDPLGYHLTNVACLAAAVVCLFSLVRNAWPEAPLAAWAAALLFAVHPIHDEAVTYLAARGHVMSVALSLFALVGYARWRKAGKRRVPWLSAALLAALLAALAKETALILPVWIAAWEWLVPRDENEGPGDLVAASVGGALFAVPALATLVLRWAVVGLESDKLEGAGSVVSFLQTAWEQVPSYVLLAGLPFPFAFVSFPTLEAWWPLGLLLAVACLGTALVTLVARLRPAMVTRANGLILFGLVVSSSSLSPIFWADVELRRRYAFAASLGAVIVIAIGIQRLATRRRTAALAILILCVAAGAVGTVYRNQLYRHSGEMARALIEAARGAPIGVPVHGDDPGNRRIGLLSLPRAWGGDGLSGAYLMHHTDARSALKVFEAGKPEIDYALKNYFADDWSARIVAREPDMLTVQVGFRTRAAFESSRRRDPDDDRRGDGLRARLAREDPESLTLTYEILIAPRFRGAGARVLILEDGRFRVLPPLDG